MALSRKGKIIIGVTAVALLAIIIVATVFATRKDVAEVTVVEVKTRSTLKSTVTAPGEIRPVQYINLTSEVQGRIVEIFVKEGDPVTQGQQLVKLDPTQLQSSTEAQLAAYQAALSETQVQRSQISAAQNQLSQAQQGLNSTQASVDTALQAVASARQGVVTAQTDVDSAQVNLNAAIRELKRSEELLESGVISKLEYDQAKDLVATRQAALRNSQARLQSQRLSINEAESRVKEARARVREQEISVKDARRGVNTATYSAQASGDRAQQQAASLRAQRDQRDKTLQLAPISGIIAEIPSKVGTFAVANLSSTPLLTIADMSSINVEVKVDETEIDKVEVGQEATIKVDTFGDRELVGKVSQKTPLAVGKSQTSGGLSTNINVQEAKEFRVVIELEGLPDELKTGLRPGMSATAVINTKTVNNVVAVPIQAVIEKKPDASPTPAAEGDAPAVTNEKVKAIKGVYLLDGNKVKFVEVTTGITGESDIQVINGLSEGDQVITGPSRILNKLKEGEVVKKQTKKEGESSPGS
ncbi:MAG: efflux RND transporter periplasmic adaptor subunit [Pyrinomonadaceae bacterium]